HKAHFAIPESEVFRCQHKLQVLLFTRPKRHALKSLQLLYWAGHARGYVARIKLDYFIAGTFADVLNVDGDRQVATRSNTLSTELQVSDLKLRVAQAVAEGKLGSPRNIEILRSVAVGGLWRTAGVHVIVIDWHLP